MIIMNSDGKIENKKGSTVDFVFVYEVKKREMQGCALIAYELTRRGYSVGFINTWHGLLFDDVKYNAKVAIVFEAYNTPVTEFALGFVESCRNVFNMQWEQILSDECLEPGSVYILEGLANKVYHAAWGSKNCEHLTDYCNIPSEQVRKVGHVGFDFFRKELKNYYMEREVLCKKYSIDSNSKIIVFISSFADPELREAEFERVMIESQKTIADWLIRYAKEEDNVTIIYRPHPTEIMNPEFQKVLENNQKIRVIGDYSVQQWITVSDVILNWWSTSLGDVYAAGKSFVLLRPLEIPKRDDYYIFRGAKSAKTYEEMLEQISGDVEPVEKSEVEKYYYFEEDRGAYQRIVDTLQELYDGEAKFEYQNSSKRKIKDKGIIMFFRQYYGLIKSKILGVIKKDPSVYQEVEYYFTMMRRNYVPEKEIVKMMNNIRELMS